MGLYRYNGDILAWIHQACVSEREMLDSVFGLASRAGIVLFSYLY